MRDLDENSITDAVTKQVSGAPDERVRALGVALVKHLHAFIREVRPTQEEWEAGIAFLTATGQKCDGQRQEFILLSDVLGVSTLVDSINNPVSGGSTETTVFGPFYVPAPQFQHGEDIKGTLDGMPMHIQCTVRGPEGQPVTDASVDVWHSDDQGFYDVQQLDALGGLGGRGQFHTGLDGGVGLWTVRPCAYPIPTDGPVGDLLRAQNRHAYRPEHVHFMIQAPGYRRLVTHVFASGDQYLASDAVFGVKTSLIRDYLVHSDGSAPDGRAMRGGWCSLNYDFTLTPQAAG